MSYSVPGTVQALRAALEESGAALPIAESAASLTAPCAVGGREAHNRIAYQAMEGCDGTAAGAPDELTCRRYLRFAHGGPGIIWFEATAVCQEGRANPRQLYLTEQTLDGFQRLVEQIKETSLRENGFAPLIFCQLTHSGRYSKPNGFPEPLIAYSNPLFEGDRPIEKDRILSDDDLDRIGDALAQGAALAQRAGFDGADIKCCHRYLLSELLSAYTRPGKYGGSFENRTRLLRESVEKAVAGRSGGFLIGSRLNIYDGFPYPYGFGVSEESGLAPVLTEPVRLAGMLQQAGLDILNITMGNPYVNPHVNRPFAMGPYAAPEHPACGVERMLTGTREVRKALSIPVICSGLSWLGAPSVNVAAACVSESWFDFAGYGRETLADPDLARRITQTGALDRAHTCVACGKCSELMRAGGTPGCIVRDSGLYAPLYRQFVTERRK